MESEETVRHHENGSVSDRKKRFQLESINVRFMLDFIRTTPNAGYPNSMQPAPLYFPLL